MRYFLSFVGSVGFLAVITSSSTTSAQSGYRQYKGTEKDGQFNIQKIQKSKTYTSEPSHISKTQDYAYSVKRSDPRSRRRDNSAIYTDSRKCGSNSRDSRCGSTSTSGRQSSSGSRSSSHGSSHSRSNSRPVSSYSRSQGTTSSRFGNGTRVTVELSDDNLDKIRSLLNGESVELAPPCIEGTAQAAPYIYSYYWGADGKVYYNGTDGRVYYFDERNIWKQYECPNSSPDATALNTQSSVAYQATPTQSQDATWGTSPTL